jgi:predicted nucleic acid-binding protein
VGRFTERLKPFSTVGLDTTAFIYHLEGHPSYLPLTLELFASIETGSRTGITSTITLLEIIVRPLSLNRSDIARKYEALLSNFPNLKIVDLDRDVIRQTAQLRAEYRIGSPDALQAGAGLIHGANVFITNDRRLERLRDKLDVIILDDFVENN